MGTEKNPPDTAEEPRALTEEQIKPFLKYFFDSLEGGHGFSEDTLIGVTADTSAPPKRTASDERFLRSFSSY